MINGMLNCHNEKFLTSLLDEKEVKAFAFLTLTFCDIAGEKDRSCIRFVFMMEQSSTGCFSRPVMLDMQELLRKVR